MPALTRDFGWGRAEVSGAMTVGSLGGALLSPVAGPLVDRYGGKALIAGGALVMTICLALLAMLQDIWQFYILFAIGRAIASGVLTLAATVTVSKWFIRRRGVAVGGARRGTGGALRGGPAPEGARDAAVGARWTLVVGLIGSAAGMVILMSVHGTGMAMAYAALYGVAFGVMVGG